MPRVERWIVGPDLAEGFGGEGGEPSYRIKRPPGGDWEYFTGGVEGFEHQPGSFALIEVEVSEVLDPPSGASSLRHVMVREVGRADSEAGLP